MRLDLFKSVLVGFALISLPVQGQSIPAIEVADSAVSEMFSLQLLSTIAKGEAKAADSRRDHRLAGKLRTIHAQSNAMAGSLYSRLVTGLVARRNIVNLKRDFANFDRHEFSGLVRSIQSVTEMVGPDYAGAAITATGNHETTKQTLELIDGSSSIYTVPGFICAAHDSRTEEHAHGHFAVAIDELSAREAAMDNCMQIHGACKIVRCQQGF